MKIAINCWFRRAVIGDDVVGMYSADDSEGHKTKLVKRVRNRKFLVVICTDALGMGSDVKEVRRVIQWRLDSTTTLTSWWQRIGRAGRDFSTDATGYLFVETSLQETGLRNYVERVDSLPSAESDITTRDWTGRDKVTDDDSSRGVGTEEAAVGAEDGGTDASVGGEPESAIIPTATTRACKNSPASSQPMKSSLGQKQNRFRKR